MKQSEADHGLWEEPHHHAHEWHNGQCPCRGIDFHDRDYHRGWDRCQEGMYGSVDFQHLVVQYQFGVGLQQPQLCSRQARRIQQRHNSIKY